MAPLTHPSPQPRSDAQRASRAPADKHSQSIAAPIGDQVNLALASLVRGRDPSALSHLVQLRARRIKRMYADLARAGERVRVVGDLQERHARALLDYWRSKGNAPATIKSDWSVLRTWMADLGKSDLVKPIAHYWKDAPKPPKPRAPGSPLPARHPDAALVNLLGDGKDRTHYLVERLCQTFRMRVQDAFTLNAATLGAILDGRRPLGLPRALDKAVSQLSPEGTVLLSEVKQFLALEGREALLWSNANVPQGIRRHENHLAYVRRRRSQAAKDPP